MVRAGDGDTYLRGGAEEDALSQTVEELPLSNEPTPSKAAGEFPVTGQGLQFIPTAR